MATKDLVPGLGSTSAILAALMCRRDASCFQRTTSSSHLERPSSSTLDFCLRLVMPSKLEHVTQIRFCNLVLFRTSHHWKSSNIKLTCNSLHSQAVSSWCCIHLASVVHSICLFILHRAANTCHDGRRSSTDTHSFHEDSREPQLIQTVCYLICGATCELKDAPLQMGISPRKIPAENTGIFCFLIHTCTIPSPCQLIFPRS